MSGDIMSISKTVHDIPPSPTIAVKAVADELKAKGEVVYDFGVGEMIPYFQLPQGFVQATTDAMWNNESHYISPQGHPRLLAALSRDFANFHLEYHENELCVLPGPKPALYTTMTLVLEPNVRRNRVVIWSPAYESFRDLTTLITHQPAIILDTDDKCYPDVAEFEKTLASRDDIRCVIINSPNNPSGVVFSDTTMKDIANIVKKYPEVVVISDEVYRTILYDDTPYVSIARYLKEQSIVVGGISKEIAGTGIRLGFLAAPQHVIAQATKLIGNIFSCANVPSQVGYAAFLESDVNMEIRREFAKRLAGKRNAMITMFKTIPGFSKIDINAPQGAFYFFSNFSRYLGMKTPEGKVIEDDKELSLYLLKRAKVAMIPGSYFGKPGRLRIAFAAASDAEIKAGLEAMGEALTALSE